MKIIHVKSMGILSEQARRKLEETFYPDMENAVAELRTLFPHHNVVPDSGYVRVTNKDGSINVALFKDEKTADSRIETGFGFRSILEAGTNRNIL
jgi:hypothetical protein